MVFGKTNAVRADDTSTIGSLMNLVNWVSSTNLVTRNTIAHWDGRYATTNDASNLSYCSRGQFGDIVTHSVSEFLGNPQVQQDGSASNGNFSLATPSEYMGEYKGSIAIGDLLICWGSIGSNNYTARVTVTFDVHSGTFKGIPSVVVSLFDNGSNNQNHPLKVTGITTSTFEIWDNSTNMMAYHYIAIGQKS